MVEFEVLDLEQSQVGKLKFELICQRDCVHVLHSMVEVIALRAGLTDVETNRVALAVDELFANITDHGYGDTPGRVQFESKIHINDDGMQELHFMFRDYAPVVDIQGWGCGDTTPCSAADITPGGLGMQLIHSIMDVVEHVALDDGNQWTLIYICKQGTKGVGDEA